MQAAPSHVLDDSAEWQAFSRPVPGQDGAWESYLAIEGIYCAGCSGAGWWRASA
jgi:Cu2+-exporting ATPase